MSGRVSRAILFAVVALVLVGPGCAKAQTAAPAQTPPESVAAPEAAPIYSAQVVNAYPHDRSAFTEGLFFKDGALYESTGYEGRSSIRKVELATGKVLQRRDLDKAYFGEGIVAFKDRLIELTWKSEVGFIYDLKSFAPKGRFTYKGEGWALTTDGRRIIMSDGTNTLRFLDPQTLKQTGSVSVTYGGKKVIYLNELEWVKGEVWANIWTTDEIVRIDPSTGKVLGWINLSGLLPDRERDGNEDVLNGIAYDAEHDRIFVTGKQWPKLYEIKLLPPSPPVAPVAPAG